MMYYIGKILTVPHPELYNLPDIELLKLSVFDGFP